jgi:hypothetical protein
MGASLYTIVCMQAAEQTPAKDDEDDDGLDDLFAE